MQKINNNILWIDEALQDWEYLKFKYVFSLNKGLTITKEDLQEKGIPCVNYGEIHSKYGFEVIPEKHALKYVDSSYFETSPNMVINKGDFVFADTSEDMEGVGNFTCLWSDTSIFAGYHTIIARLKEKFTSRYFAYLFSSDLFRNQIRNKVSGIKVFSITQAILKNTILAVPPLKTQQKIADFLDAKCSKIDSTIEQEKTQIVKLKEYRQSLIAEAVTKGINPNVPMKDSGIEWIGEIPQGWEVKKIKYIFKLREGKNSLPLSEVQLLSLYTELGVFPHGEQEERGNKAVNADGYKIVNKNDIVVNIILAWMGAIGISKYDGVTSPAYDVYTPFESTYSLYYHYLFRTKEFTSECYKYGRGIMQMRWRTYSTEFKGIFVMFPPLEEQKQIADYLDTKTAQIDNAIAKKETLITKLQEYKKSLIFEAVTGKIEV